MKTQYRFRWNSLKGSWRDTKSGAIMDALELGWTGSDEEIEMRSVPYDEPNYAASFGGDVEQDAQI